MTKVSVRAWVRRGATRVVMGTGLLAALLAGCGGHTTPAPLSPAAALSDFFSTAADSRFGYSSVLVTVGQGTHRFVRASWPRRIGVEMSCRGGRSVKVTVGGRFLVEVFCAPGVAGGARNTIRRASILEVSATPRTRWSLVVAGANR